MASTVEVRQILLAVVVLRGQLVMQVAAVVAIATLNQLVWLLPRRFELTGLRYSLRGFCYSLAVKRSEISDSVVLRTTPIAFSPAGDVP